MFWYVCTNPILHFKDKQFLTDENVGGQSVEVINHAQSVLDQSGAELQACVTELSNELLTVTVDQPVTNSDEPHPPTCSGAHPPISGPHSDNDSNPLHASSNEPHPHASSNDKPQPVAEDKTTSDHRSPLLVPSNQLLFELD